MTEVMAYATAGGVVVNGRLELLTLGRTVTRNGKPREELRLPKGHIDPGETVEQAACREVGEESGYWGVEILADLKTCHSSFYLDGIQYERDEHYFLMRLADEARSEPAPVSEEEALFVPRWVPLVEGQFHLTYPSEQEFAWRAKQWLDQHPSRSASLRDAK